MTYTEYNEHFEAVRTSEDKEMLVNDVREFGGCVVDEDNNFIGGSEWVYDGMDFDIEPEPEIKVGTIIRYGEARFIIMSGLHGDHYTAVNLTPGTATFMKEFEMIAVLVNEAEIIAR